MKVLIVADGESLSPARQKQMAQGVDSIYVIDGACRKVMSDLSVTVICGDFDGITPGEAKERFSNAAIVPLPDQYLSDFEKTINLAIQDGATELIITGALGNRIDHSLVALSCLLRFHRQLPTTLVTDDSDTFFLSPECPRSGRLHRRCAANQIISLVSWEQSSEVTITGVKWPLHGATLEAGSAGVSNRALGGDVEVAVASGAVIATFQSSAPESI